MSAFHTLTPFLIITTLLVCIAFGKGVNKKDLFTIDGMLSFIGCIFGIFMTIFNLKYVSNELFLLSPLIGITCIFYLRFRRNILSNSLSLDIPLNRLTLNRMLKCVNILYWCFFSLALISYVKSPVYYRSLPFFVSISICISLIGVLIIYSDKPTKISLLNIFTQIILLSLILSASVFFISSYPIGSDPWVHFEYIKYFLDSSHFATGDSTLKVSTYYLDYPLAHLFSVVFSHIVNVDSRLSFYMIGVVLILSTPFTYLFVKEVCNSSNIALFSVLLLSFASFHIRWTILVIAMSLGLAFYSIIIYLIMKSHLTSKNNKTKYQLLFIFFIFIIIWTHTVSAFIALVTIMCLYLSYYILQKALHLGVEETMPNLTLCLIIVIALLYHWMFQDYSFFDRIVIKLVSSLSSGVRFLNPSVHSRFPAPPVLSNITDNYGMLLFTLGFLIYTFFGIIGSLLTISKFRSSPAKLSLLFTAFVLYIFRYLFPMFGMETIVPDRWPSFIYAIFVLFISIGFFNTLSFIKSPKNQISFIFIILFVASFFMITNNETNFDSPIYGGDAIQRLVWTDSEMALFTHINESYNNVIVTDEQTKIRPFKTYLHRSERKLGIYPLNKKAEINWNLVNDKLIIWRKTSLTRQLSCFPINVLLGHGFETRLNNNFSCIYDTGEAKAFLKP